MSSVMRIDAPKPSDIALEQINDIKGEGERFHFAVNALRSIYGNSREFAIAMTKIEEAVMWAVKGIAIADENKEGNP